MYEFNSKSDHNYTLIEKTKTFSLLGTKESKQSGLTGSFRLDASVEAMKRTAEQF